MFKTLPMCSWLEFSHSWRRPPWLTTNQPRSAATRGAAVNGSATGGTAGSLTPQPQSLATSGTCDGSENFHVCDCCDEPFWSVAAAPSSWGGRVSIRSRSSIRSAARRRSPMARTSFPDFSTGTDFTFEHRLFRDNSVEVRYFGGFDWASDVNYGAAGNIQLGSIANFGATGLTASDNTFLNSIEIEAAASPWRSHHAARRWARWLGLRDDLQYQVTFPAFGVAYEWNVDNRLLGADRKQARALETRRAALDRCRAQGGRRFGTRPTTTLTSALQSAATSRAERAGPRRASWARFTSSRPTR